MVNRILVASLLAAMGQVAPALVDTPMTFTLEKVDLPTGDRMFPGGDKAVAINNCVTCHSAGMVLHQPALSRSEWAGEVHKMVGVYKAPVSPEDQAASSTTWPRPRAGSSDREALPTAFRTGTAMPDHRHPHRRRRRPCSNRSVRNHR